MRRFSRLRKLAATCKRPSSVLPSCKPRHVTERWARSSMRANLAVVSKLYFVVLTGGRAPPVAQPVGKPAARMQERTEIEGSFIELVCYDGRSLIKTTVSLSGATL